MAKASELLELATDLPNLNRTFELSESVFLSTARRKVFRQENCVLKFGLDVNRCEAKTIRFIRERTSVPVPELYCDYIHPDGTAVVAMEYMEGRILSELWPVLSHSDKMEITGQLREILEKMRQHRSSFIGGVDDTPAVDTRKFKLKGGPFSTEKQFNEFLRSNIIPAAPEIYHLMLQRVMKENHDIVLTHGDLNPRNIVVNDGRIVAILDWENAGWYPEYWEYVKFFNALDFSLDWHNYSDNIFPQTYPHQFMGDQFLSQVLRH